MISTIFLAHPLGPNATTERTNTVRDERLFRSSVMFSNSDEEANPAVVAVAPTVKKGDKR
jgi:hypothetical protein